MRKNQRPHWSPEVPIDSLLTRGFVRGTKAALEAVPAALACKGGIIDSFPYTHPSSGYCPWQPDHPMPGSISFTDPSQISMALTHDDIARIANLARLELNQNESERMLAGLNQFFEVVEQISAVDTTGITPLSHPVAAIKEIELRLRDDVVSEPNNREANQKSAPAVEKGYFLVPKVIE